MPTFPSGPSAAPTMTGVPAGSPARAATSGRRPSRAVVARTGASEDALTPATRSAPGSHVPVRRSSSPVPDAEEGSLASVPVRLHSTHSLRPTHHRTRDARPGSVPGVPGQLRQRRHRVERDAGAPVERCRLAGAPQLGDHGGGPRVRPGEQGGERGRVAVEPEEPVHRGTDRDGDDVLATDVADAVGEGGEDPGRDGVRVLGAASRLGVLERVLPDGRMPGRRVADGERRRLRGGGAHIDTDDDLVHVTQRTRQPLPQRRRSRRPTADRSAPAAERAEPPSPAKIERTAEAR